MVILSTGIAFLDACSVWLVIVSFHKVHQVDDENGVWVRAGIWVA